MLNSAKGVTAWLDTVPLEPAERIRLGLTEGTHRVTLAVSLAERTEPIRAVIEDVAGSEAQVQLVSGK